MKRVEKVGPLEAIKCLKAGGKAWCDGAEVGLSTPTGYLLCWIGPDVPSREYVCLSETSIHNNWTVEWPDPEPAIEGLPDGCELWVVVDDAYERVFQSPRGNREYRFHLETDRRFVAYLYEHGIHGSAPRGWVLTGGRHLTAFELFCVDAPSPMFAQHYEQADCIGAIMRKQ